MPGPGRPTKYDEARAKRITDAISLGATRHLACKYAGIDQETITAWERKYPEFKQAVREAEGAASVGWLAKIERAADTGDWRAAAWKLERLHADDYGRTVSETRHSGTITILTAEQLQELSDDEFSAYTARLRESTGGGGSGTAPARLRLAGSS